MENDVAPDVQITPMAKLQGSRLQQTETGWSNVTLRCILFMCGEANKGELGPEGAGTIGQGWGTSQVMSTGKSTSTPFQVLIFIWPSVRRIELMAGSCVNPQEPQIHTHAPLCYLSAAGHAPLPWDARVEERI